MVSLLSSVRAASRWVIGVGSQNPKSPSGTVAVGLLRDVSPGFGEFRSCVPYAREDGRPPDGLEQLGAARKMLESHLHVCFLQPGYRSYSLPTSRYMAQPV